MAEFTDHSTVFFKSTTAEHTRGLKTALNEILKRYDGLYINCVLDNRLNLTDILFKAVTALWLFRISVVEVTLKAGVRRAITCTSF